MQNMKQYRKAGMKMRRHEFGNQDEREKGRELSEAEKRRLAQFEKLTEQMIEKGYKKVELTVGITNANAFALILLAPAVLIGFGLFHLVDGGLQFESIREIPFTGFLIFMAVYLLLIVVHELIHGFSWALFAEHHFQDVEFGFMKEYLTPYCTCKVPLLKGQYIFGALMPLILLGILPMAIGIAVGSVPVLLMGILATDGAAGDILIVWNILRYKTSASEVVYIDHPTQVGGVIFEK